MHLFSTSSRLASHYGLEDGRYLVEVHVSDARSLFNSLDPAPFIEKDLDSDADDYIVDTVQDFPLATPLKLVIYLPGEKMEGENIDAIPEAIRNYFGYRAHHADMKLRYLLLRGRTSLLIGLLFLFGCIIARELTGGLLQPGLMHDVIEEGFLICGWVAMWRPIQIYLYGWWPIRRMRLGFDKIREMPIEVRALPHGCQESLSRKSS